MNNILVIGDSHIPFEKKNYLNFCIDTKKWALLFKHTNSPSFSQPQSQWNWSQLLKRLLSHGGLNVNKKDYNP